MIIFRYITKDVLATTLAILLIFLVIFVSMQLAMFLDQMAAGSLDSSLFWKILGMLIATLLNLLLPMSFFIALLLNYGRLYAESEMVSLFACGMTRRTLVFYTLIIGLVIAAISGYLSFILSPKIDAYRQTLVENTLDQNIMTTISPGRFQQTNEGRKVFYVQSVSRDKGQLENIFLAEQGGLQGNFLQTKQATSTEKSNHNNWNVMLAKTGFQREEPDKGGRYLVVQEGNRYVSEVGQKNMLLIQYDSYGVRLPDIHSKQQDPNRVENWPTENLIHHYFDNRHAAAELQWRVALPLQIFILALLAVPLSRTAPRQGRYVPLFPAVLIYSLYVNGLFLGRDFMDKGLLNVNLGLWIVHLCLILVALYLYVGKPSWSPIEKFSHYWRN